MTIGLVAMAEKITQLKNTLNHEDNQNNENVPNGEKNTDGVQRLHQVQQQEINAILELMIRIVEKRKIILR